MARSTPTKIITSSSSSTLMPFLYPCLFRSRAYHTTRYLARPSLAEINDARRAAAHEPVPEEPSPIEYHRRRLNPTPDDYARNIFVDKCKLTVAAGSGGNGCVSFHRDAIISDGPPNGGDGGSGGNVWIQAVTDQTSLHKIARRGVIKAGRGVSGQGKAQGGRKGDDVCIQVPVGTVLREIWRSDPVADEEARLERLSGLSPEEREVAELESLGPRSNPWIMYPGAIGKELKTLEETIPQPPRPRRSALAAMQPGAPIHLDLDKPMDKPMLLAAGAMGGLGNPHFLTKGENKPKYATKGELGIRLKFEVELKLLADVALVGLPNAGKSTLLRSISNSRTRVGDWAFTTLEPSIGTVILDSDVGRPLIKSGIEGQAPRTNFTVADIPGLVEDAHLDKGLGLGFLRHVERARIMAFVIDLSSADPVETLKALWKEVGEYETMRNIEINEQSQKQSVAWSGFGADSDSDGRDENQNQDGMLVFPEPSKRLEPLKLPPISAKPWYVVATKADLTETQDAFARLQQYLTQVETGVLPHPSGQQNAWKARLAALPVSAINGHGTNQIAQWTANLLDSMQGASALRTVTSS